MPSWELRLQVAHLGSSSIPTIISFEEPAVEESAAEAEQPKKKKSRWTEEPLLPVKPWQVGESCQVTHSILTFEIKLICLGDIFGERRVP
jgi:hypothetical protein